MHVSLPVTMEARDSNCSGFDIETFQEPNASAKQIQEKKVREQSDSSIKITEVFRKGRVLKCSLSVGNVLIM